MSLNQLMLKLILNFSGKHSVCMETAKSKLKCAAALRNLTDLKPVIYNKTGWCGKHQMLKRLGEIRDELIEVLDRADVELGGETSSLFINRARKYEKMLGAINYVTVELQEKGATLSQCRNALDSLLDAVADEKASRSAPFFGCKLDGTYILPDSDIVKYPTFESAVIKIQNGESCRLTRNEKREVTSLLRRNAIPSNGQNSSPVHLSMHDRLAKRRRTNKGEAYIDCSFILGSVAEAERVWSMYRSFVGLCLLKCLSR